MKFTKCYIVPEWLIGRSGRAMLMVAEGQNRKVKGWKTSREGPGLFKDIAIRGGFAVGGLGLRITAGRRTPNVPWILFHSDDELWSLITAAWWPTVGLSTLHSLHAYCRVVQLRAARIRIFLLIIFLCIWVLIKSIEKWCDRAARTEGLWLKDEHGKDEGRTWPLQEFAIMSPWKVGKIDHQQETAYVHYVDLAWIQFHLGDKLKGGFKI